MSEIKDKLCIVTRSNSGIGKETANSLIHAHTTRYSSSCPQQSKCMICWLTTMRMWMVDPRIMCRQHLLGEHAEIHMFIGTINHGNSVEGYLEKGLLEIHNLYYRHYELVREMKSRNYKHNSPISKKWKQARNLGSVDKEKNLKQLISRCSRCRERHERTFSNV